MRFFVGVAAAALMLVGYQELSRRSALLKAEQAQINPSFAYPPDALPTSDPLYRAIYGPHGGYGSYQEANVSSLISSLLYRYIKQQDWGWNLNAPANRRATSTATSFA